jgi:hypothetical protein
MISIFILWAVSILAILVGLDCLMMYNNLREVRKVKKCINDLFLEAVASELESIKTDQDVVH